MQKFEIIDKLNELKNCKWITITRNNHIQVVLYSDIINYEKDEFLFYKLDNTKFYYKDITALMPSPLDEARL